MEDQAKIEADKIQLQTSIDQEIKAKYKAVEKIVITEGTEERKAYFRKPSRLAIGSFLSKKDENLVEACEALFYDAIIKEVSDADYFLANDEAFLGCMPALIRISVVKKNISTTSL